MTNLDYSINSHDRVFVKFSTSWCGPCKIMDPIVKKIMEENKDIFYVSIDAETDKELVEKYEITTVPTCLYFENGKLIDKKSGALSAKALEQFLKIV